MVAGERGSGRILILVLVLSAGCSAVSHDVEDFPDVVCAPGETQSCFCEPGEGGSLVLESRSGARVTLGGRRR